MKYVLNFLFIVLSSFYCHGQSLPIQEQYTLDIYIESDEGDYIGQGCVHHCKKNVPPIALIYKNLLEIDIDGWSFSFIGSNNETLKQGVYLNAERYYFQKLENPGLCVNGPDRACMRVAGEFTVIDIAYNESNQIISLALDFIQYCESDDDQLRGYIRYNSLIPLPKFNYPLSISMYSQKNEWVGRGVEHYYKETLHHLYPVFGCKPNTIVLSAGGYNFEFVVPSNDSISIGIYNALRFCYSGDNPGMNIGGNGRGCNNIEGNYQVIDIEYDEDGAITTLAIDFIQYCDDYKMKSPLIGSIRYNSEIPLSCEYTLLLNFGAFGDSFEYFDYFYSE